MCGRALTRLSIIFFCLVNLARSQIPLRYPADNAPDRRTDVLRAQSLLPKPYVVDKTLILPQTLVTIFLGLHRGSDDSTLSRIKGRFQSLSRQTHLDLSLKKTTLLITSLSWKWSRNSSLPQDLSGELIQPDGGF